MPGTEDQAIRTFLFAGIWTAALGSQTQASVASDSFADYSSQQLEKVPSPLSPDLTTLDVSRNNISVLEAADFRSLAKLRVLVLSHNRIRHLDTSVFEFNPALEFVDVAHNELESLSCHPAVAFRHLDLSFNLFERVPVCREFGHWLQLDFLGLSARRIRKADLQPLADLHLREVLLHLRVPEGPVSLCCLHTEKLHLVFSPWLNLPSHWSLSNSTPGSLEITNIQLVNGRCSDLTEVLSEAMQDLKLLNLTLNNVETTWECLVAVFQLVWPRNVEYLNIYNLTLFEEINEEAFDTTETSLKGVKLELMTNKVLYFSQDNIYGIFAKMNISSLTITNSPFIHMLCPTGASRWLHLDMSNNVLTDTIFETCTTLVHLETLIFRGNQLKNLVPLSRMTKTMRSLQHLDLSLNFLQFDGDAESCDWSASLSTLDLSSNKLTGSVFRCLPPRVTVLDLHGNQIRSIPKEAVALPALRELNVALNFLADLPDCGAFRSLTVLRVDGNSIPSPSPAAFRSCQNLRRLWAGNNPFACGCNLRQFIGLAASSSNLLEGWPDAYVCASSEGHDGTLLKDVHLPELACNIPLLVGTVLVTLSVVAAAGAALCRYLDVPWYLRMTWQWAQTRRRARRATPVKLERMAQFHVFVSYSERDATWVKAELIPNLESAAISVCLHERNFVPGKSIVENIISCIEKSRKSIFVLSPHFVQSEWCHYELCFAHHRLFQEGSDSLILIVLAPIPRHGIPARYHKLKSLMARKTYLEWPQERSKQGLFWANLRVAVNVDRIVSGKGGGPVDLKT
ncbi:toll-like receptor 6 [Ornithorhynchus anatinus]|uniref:TIR domain-containing protein n=1 Tax=Ornithorhynchus anatinus TaxID=9258 RepID=A0A6I8PK96_ORNAN|nr:toll-like receptor 6 [Ornithorhynchus anatinus]